MPAPKGIIPFFSTLLDSYTTTKNLQKLKRMHTRMIITGISRHDFIRAKLVESYSVCAQLYEAVTIFSYTNRQSTFLYNTLIRALCSNNWFSDSLVLFREMLRAGKRLDHQTLPSVLKCCAGIPALRIGSSVHVLVVSNGFELDVANSNALVTMYGKCGDLRSARKVFDEMSERDVVTWSAMMSGYGLHGRSKEVSELFERMVDDGVAPDVVTFTDVLTTCSHCGLTEKGKEYFEIMKNKFGLSPSLEHYTCMVDMLGRARRVEEAAAMVEVMDVAPDNALWGALLAACKPHGKVEVVERLAEKIYARKLSATQ